MIRFIKGIISTVGDSYVVLDCHDIGYLVSMPSDSLFKLTEGMEVKIHTHMSVREDDVSLYGFLSSEDLRMFQQLITVSGIGPKAALSILSEISTEELILAIAAGDAKLISKAKGVGLKTAQKLVVELKDKFKDTVISVKSDGSAAKNNDIETAVLFATSTGVSRAQCMKALAAVQIPDSADVDMIIDLIFKNLNV